MAEYRAAVMTDEGINLLADSLAEGYRIEFVKMVIGSGEYSEEEKKTDVLRKCTSLKEKQQEFGFSSVKSTEESEILLKAVISNAALDTGYYMREIGIVAKKEGDTEEILYSVAIAEVPDFLPGKENPTEVIQEYYTKVHNAENVIINVKQGAYATAEDMQSVLTPEFEENEEIENIESRESIFSILGKIKRAIRGLIEHKTSGDHDSRYLLKSAVVNTNTVTEAGYALDARQANPNVAGSLGAQIDTLNKTLTDTRKGKYSSINPVTDLNDFYNGIGLFSDSTLNLPESDWFLVVSGGAGGTTCQRAVKLWGGGEYHRYCAASTWSTWSSGTISWGNVTGKPETYQPSVHNHDTSYVARDGSVSKLFLTNKITNWAMLTAIINGSNYAIPISGSTDTGYIEHIGMVWRNNKRQLRICWRQDGAEYINYLNVDE